MKKIIILILLLIPYVSADVVITEVMYNPTFCSDTECEWIEIYNNGSSPVDLKDWKLDNGNFDDYIIKPNEFVVIAKSLEGFEAFYGNNDTMWNYTDGNYIVLKGTFSLTNTQDTINLSGSNEDILTYESSWGGDGNDYSLQKIDYNKGNEKNNWNESSTLKGTPGKDNFLKENTDIKITLNIIDVVPVILITIFPDESLNEGYQILPAINNNKTVSLNITIDSQKPITKVEAKFNNLSKQAIKINYEYLVNFSLEPYLKSGNYGINVTAYTNTTSNSEMIYFDYLGIISASLDKNSIEFGDLIPGKTTQNKTVKIFNRGNTNINIKISATNLTSQNNVIPAGYIKQFFKNWRGLTNNPEIIELNLIPSLDSFNELIFKIESPANATKDTYTSTIKIIAIES